MIEWQANVMNSSWFTAVICTKGWKVTRCTDKAVAHRLVHLLKVAGAMNPMLFLPSVSSKITTETGFAMNWGFGSSSAMIANLAQWAKVDPFDLYFGVSQGSGADIAASLSPGPILYRLQDGKPVIKAVNFRPRFHTCIWFVYLGQKQNTENSVNDFKTKVRFTKEYIDTCNKLTYKILQAEDLISFENAMREHEILMAVILGKTRVKEERFPDFHGEVKSLGAWGGDFVMATSAGDEGSVRSYFKGKGLEIVLSFEELVLH